MHTTLAQSGTTSDQLLDAASAPDVPSASARPTDPSPRDGRLSPAAVVPSRVRSLAPAAATASGERRASADALESMLAPRAPARWALPVAAGAIIGMCLALAAQHAFDRRPPAPNAQVATVRASFEALAPDIGADLLAPEDLAAPAPAPGAFERTRSTLDARLASDPRDLIARGARAALFADLALNLEARATALEMGAATPLGPGESPDALREQAEGARSHASHDLVRAARGVRALPRGLVRACVFRSLARAQRILQAATHARVVPAHEPHAPRAARQAPHNDGAPLTIYAQAPF